VGIISAVGNLPAWLLATASWWYSRWGGSGGSIRGRGSIFGKRVGSSRAVEAIGRMPGLRLGAEKTLPEAAIFGFEVGDACLEVCRADFGGVKEGAIIARLLPSLKRRPGRSSKIRMQTSPDRGARNIECSRELCSRLSWRIA
jgi:hypothetical protein